jgi:AraC-like DNA-binding protein
VKEYTKCTTIDISGRIEVLHARYYTHSFSPHWHEEYAVGLIDAGIEHFRYRGVTHRAGVNEVVLLNAGDVHTGEGADNIGFGFRMLYIPETTMREISLPNRHPQDSFHFLNAVVTNSSVSQSLLTAHRSLEFGASSLEIESLFTAAIAEVLDKASSWALSERLLGAPAAIVSAREYLHDHLFQDISLTELSAAAGISKFHFLRAFKSRFGLPPHAYQLQQRIFAAKRLLRVLPSSEVAYTCGFADQSHFHRIFRALVGTTPGRYAAQFRSIL